MRTVQAVPPLQQGGLRLSSALMPVLLIVHHTPSPAMQAMFEAAASGSRTDEIEGVDVIIRPALTAAAADVLAADGYLLGTPVQIALDTRLDDTRLSSSPSATLRVQSATLGHDSSYILVQARRPSPVHKPGVSLQVSRRGAR
jgi:hypothetical protein